MADLFRCRVGWSGTGVVGPGVSTFYSTSGGPALNDAARAFFNTIKWAFPGTLVQWDFPGGGEIVDSFTGQATGAWSGGVTTPIISTSSFQQHPAGVGCRVVWTTPGFSHGRRVRGSTYLVPLANTMFSGDGTLDDDSRTQIATAAEVFRAASGLAIHTRPKHAGESTGGHASVTGVIVPDKVSWLKSRRT